MTETTQKYTLILMKQHKSVHRYTLMKQRKSVHKYTLMNNTKWYISIHY